MFFKTLVEKTVMGFSREFVIILTGLISSENFFKQTRRHEEASSLSDFFNTDRIFFESPASLWLHYQGEKDGHWDCFVFTRLTQYFCLNGNLSISVSCFTELQTILWCTSICGIIKWKTKTVKVSGWLKYAENKITVLQFNNETIVNSSLEIQFVGWIFNQYPEEWRVRKWNL